MSSLSITFELARTIRSLTEPASALMVRLRPSFGLCWMDFLILGTLLCHGGWSPFELVFGRIVPGLLQLVKSAWLQETD